MLICRFFVSRSRPQSKGLYVYDEPGYANDVQRCLDNSWTVWTDGKCHIERPFTLGDSVVRNNTIIDAVNLVFKDHKERVQHGGA